MKSEKNCPESIKWNIFRLILKRKTDTNDPLSYPKNMDCIGRITVVVSFHKEAVHNRAETVTVFYGHITR